MSDRLVPHGGPPGGLDDPQAGAAILEFALVLPILLALLGGAFEFGRVLLFRHAMIEGVRGGARYLARVPDPSCLGGACSPGALHAVTLTRDTILATTGVAPAALSVVPAWQPGATTVTVRAELRLDVDLLRFAGLGPAFTIAAAAEEARVGE